MKRLATTVYVVAASFVFLPVSAPAAPVQQTAQTSIARQVQAAFTKTARHNSLTRKIASYEKKVTKMLKRTESTDQNTVFRQEIMPKLKQTLEQDAQGHEGFNFQIAGTGSVQGMYRDPEATKMLAVVVLEGEYPNLVKFLLGNYADPLAYNPNLKDTLEHVALIKYGVESQVVRFLQYSADAQKTYLQYKNSMI